MPLRLITGELPPAAASITGELPPAAASITVDGTLGYLPQSLPFAGDATVAEVLRVAAAIEALDALVGGEFGVHRDRATTGTSRRAP